MELKECRDTLDRIDSQIIDLFLKRMDTVRNVAEYKKAHDLPVLAPAREAEILQRVRERSGDELAPYAATLFETLLYVSREYQKTLL